MPRYGYFDENYFGPDYFGPDYFGDIIFSELSHSYKPLSDEEILTQLKRSYKNKQLSLILGAGVSQSCGLPDWNKLLKELLKKCFDLDESSTDIDKIADYFINKVKQPLILARYIQQYLKNKNDTSFEEAIRDALYKPNIKESNLIKEICQLSNSKINQSLDSIITYNYDDILETCMRKLEIPYIVINNTGMRKKEGELPIYHVHGFLPNEEKVTSKSEIVISEETYHKQYLDIYNWSNLTQINKFSEKTCLFIDKRQ